jgi:hypothetical protein
MKIKELYMESDFIMEGESYCRKTIFTIPELTESPIRTNITFSANPEMEFIDGYAEFFDGEWKVLSDVIPKIPTLENVEEVQKDLVSSVIAILGCGKYESNQIDIDYQKYDMFKWDDLNKYSEKKEESLIKIEFNPKMK